MLDPNPEKAFAAERLLACFVPRSASVDSKLLRWPFSRSFLLAKAFFVTSQTKLVQVPS